jgi:hypothetical protein
MNWIGTSPRVRPYADIARIPVPQLLNDQILGFGNDIFNAKLYLEYTLQDNPAGTIFAQFAVNSEKLPSQPSSVGRSLVILFSARSASDGLERFFILTGGHPALTTFRSGVNREITVSMDIWGQDLQISLSPPVGITYATDPLSPLLSFYDGGVNPVSIGVTTPNVQNIEFTVNRNLSIMKALPDKGQTRSLLRELAPGLRRTTGRFKVLWQNTAQYQSLLTNASNILTWTFKTNGPSFQLLSELHSHLEDYTSRVEGGSLETLLEDYSFTGISPVLS